MSAVSYKTLNHKEEVFIFPKSKEEDKMKENYPFFVGGVLSLLQSQKCYERSCEVEAVSNGCLGYIFLKIHQFFVFSVPLTAKVLM